MRMKTTTAPLYLSLWLTAPNIQTTLALAYNIRDVLEQPGLVSPQNSIYDKESSVKGCESLLCYQVTGIDDYSESKAKVIMPVESCWVDTGNIFVWCDEDGSQTTGMLDTTSIQSPSITCTHSHVLNQTSNLNQSLDYNIHVKRYLSI
ncbi:hypothetical protein Cpir12675_004164 [Ceratocystis pirilliformis]|uniref:Uncharacterized protein n=1 Tax=Ceratocystis pirilliformis TaxID=259994 RepID=A0ABR3YZP4_9PEZI